MRRAFSSPRPFSMTDKNKARVHGDSGLACWGQGGFSGVGIDGEIHADSSATPLLTSRAPSGAGPSHGRRFIDHRGADSWGASALVLTHPEGMQAEAASPHWKEHGGSRGADSASPPNPAVLLTPNSPFN